MIWFVYGEGESQWEMVKNQDKDSLSSKCPPDGVLGTVLCTIPPAVAVISPLPKNYCVIFGDPEKASHGATNNPPDCLFGRAYRIHISHHEKTRWSPMGIGQKF